LIQRRSTPCCKRCEQVANPKNKKEKLDQPDYEILVIREGEHGWYIHRKIVFSRTDLLPHRQIVNDENGNQITDVRYGEYKEYSGVNFPSQILKSSGRKKNMTSLSAW